MDVLCKPTCYYTMPGFPIGKPATLSQYSNTGCCSQETIHCPNSKQIHISNCENPLPTDIKQSQYALHLSPALSLLNWSEMMQEKVGPSCAPGSRDSSRPPTHKSILFTSLPYASSSFPLTCTTRWLPTLCNSHYTYSCISNVSQRVLCLQICGNERSSDAPTDSQILITYTHRYYT